MSGVNGGFGIRCESASTTTYAYNSTVYNNNWGFYKSGGTVVAKNNISYGNYDNYSGTFDSSGTNNLSGLSYPPVSQ